MVCELMGRNAGWLTLSAGIASGSDVILLPEIPFDFDVIASFLEEHGVSGRLRHRRVRRRPAPRAKGEPSPDSSTTRPNRNDWAASANASRMRLSGGAASKPVPRCSAMSSAAAPPSPRIGYLRHGLASPPSITSSRATRPHGRMAQRHHQ